MKLLNLTLVALLFLSLTSCDKLGKKKKSKELVVTEEVKPEVIVQQPDTLETVAIVSEPEPMPEPVKLEPVIGYSADNYYMIVGSFLSEKLALKYANTILDMGYSPNVIYSQSEGYYRVSAQSYSDFKIAVADINTFRNNVTNRAWVHVRR